MGTERVWLLRVRFVYQLLSYLVLGPLVPLTLLHPKLRGGFGRRLGLYPASGRGPDGAWPLSRGDGPRVWFHGASAGDLLALMPVILEVRALAPGATLIVSTMTNSGYAIAESRLRANLDAYTYVPFDLPGATRRAVRAIRPDVLVLEYAEIWPNLIRASKAAGAKILLMNGRFSESLVGRYRFFHALIGNPLEDLDLLLMREEVEAGRALAIGAARERVLVTGNTKFDGLARDPDRDRSGIERLAELLGVTGQKILVAGSTHEGEEKALFGILPRLREVEPAIRMIVAPRYVERAPRVAALARAEGFRVAQRSDAERDLEGTRRADIIVLDTMGELGTAYGLATLVFVGGSFVDRGGQNILEPAAQGRPVLFGPHMENFRDSVEVLLGRGGIQVTSPAQLTKVARELLARPEEIEQLGRMAREAVQKVRGAARRNAEILLSLAKKR